MKVRCSKCFRNLGVDTRAQIYVFLEENGMNNVSVITDQIRLKQPTVSYHLKEMHESGLLKRIEKGKEVYYEINEHCPHTEGVKCRLVD